MKKFIKNNIAVILSIIVICLVISISSFKVYVDSEILKNDYINSNNWCERILQLYNPNDSCKNEITTNYNRDTLTIYDEIFNSSDYSTVVYFMLPFLTIASSLYIVSKRFRSGEVKNSLTRESYNSYMKSILKDAYKSVIIFPFVFIFTLIISYMISGTFNVNTLGLASFDIEYLNNPLLFIISYFLNTIFISFYWVNIALFIVPDTRNYIVSVIEGIMIFFGITFTNTFFVIGFIGNILKMKDLEYKLDFLDVYTYNNRNLLSFNILCLSIALISGLIVFIKYRNKERMIIRLEGNL